MKRALYLSFLIAFSSCSAPSLLKRVPGSAPNTASPCALGVQDLLVESAPLNAREIQEIANSLQARKLQETEEIKDYLQYVTDPVEREEFLALATKITQREEGLSGPEILQKLQENLSHCQ